MNVKVISTGQWLFPDIPHYPQEADRADLHAARGGYAAIQLMLSGVTPGERIRLSFSGVPAPECYGLRDVCVNFNSAPDDYSTGSLPVGVDPEPPCVRKAPYRVYDVLVPFSEGGDIVRNENQALYLCAPIPADCQPCRLYGEARISCGREQATVPFTLTVHAATVPPVKDSRLSIYNYYSFSNIGRPYGLTDFTPEWYDKYLRFMQLMVRARSTCMNVSFGHIGISEKDGRYVFDFTRFGELIEFVLKAGFRHLDVGSLCSKDYCEDEFYYLFYTPEGRKIPADSPEAYRFIASFLPALSSFLRERGLFEMTTMEVGDEPSERLAPTYRIICGIARKFIPGMPFLNAVSTPTLLGALDYCIPLNRDYQHNRSTYSLLKETGDSIWQYTCCAPRGVWLNRLLDHPLLHPRLLHWGNYRFDLPGYLHWGFNYFGAGEDAYEKTADRFPPGDTHISYPGNENGPFMSMRAEQMRMGAEDCELLWSLAEKDKAAADDICAAVLRGFDDYCDEPAAFDANELRLLKAFD